MLRSVTHYSEYFYFVISGCAGFVFQLLTLSNAIASEANLQGEPTLYIPVVFHIVYNAEKGLVTDRQVMEQLQVLNEDYSKTNSDFAQTLDAFKPAAADCKIQFFIARNENGVYGITRTSTQHGPFVNDDLHRSVSGGADAWSTEQFLNIWVADLGGGILGYASSPGTEAFKDGVAIHYEYFGRSAEAKAPYNLGRTATHEVGHWLGLLHPWGMTCEENDGIGDTPPQNRPSSGCDLTTQLCGTVAMVQNFMNTSFDGCLTFFTIEQAQRMRETLTSLRKSVYAEVPPIVTSLERSPYSVGVFPNPVKSNRTINISLSENLSNVTTMEIMDVTGNHFALEYFKQNGNELLVNLDELSRGLYLLKLHANKNFVTHKIIIE